MVLADAAAGAMSKAQKALKLPDELHYPDEFAVHGFSEEAGNGDDQGFICLAASGAVPLAFDLEAARTLAAALIAAIAAVERGIDERKRLAQPTKARSA